MIGKKLTKRTILAGPLLAALLGGGVLVGCGPASGLIDGQGSGTTASQEASKGGGGESGGEHRGGSGEEDTANQLAPDETFDMVRNGARLILSYDANGNAFTGTVENTTNNVLRQVRIEVHLSNGAELGPTTPVDLAPGEKVAVNLSATAAAFNTWVAHAEVGSGGGEGGGEHGSGGEQSGGG